MVLIILVNVQRRYVGVDTLICALVAHNFVDLGSIVNYVGKKTTDTRRSTYNTVCSLIILSLLLYVCTDTYVSNP